MKRPLLPNAVELPCPECPGKLVLRNLRAGFFYGCTNWPACRVSHGCHADGSPIGIPGDAPTRAARRRAHAVFDPLWQEGELSRPAAYRWMRIAMGLTKDDAHIGRFTVEQCEQLIKAVEERRRLMP